MLIVLACAVYWGFSQGSGIEKYIPASLTGSAPKAASSAPSSAKKDDSLYGEVTDMVSTFASGVTGTTDSGHAFGSILYESGRWQHSKDTSSRQIHLCCKLIDDRQAGQLVDWRE